MSFIRFQRHSLKTRVTLFTLVIFLISIWSLAFYTSGMLREDMQRLLSEQQFSTSALVANEIDKELSDRLRALETAAAQLSPAMQGNPAKVQTTLETLAVFQTLFNGGTFVTGLDGIAIASIPRSLDRLGVHYLDRDYISSALRQGKTSIGRPIVGQKLKVPVFAMAAPIRGAQGQVIGALAGGVNLGLPNFLNKITENRYGATGSFLLVAPQHRLIVAASDQRRNMEILPAPHVSPALERFIGGYEGSEILVNPLGVEVLASVKRVPTAGWYVAVTLPTEEVFAPVHTLQLRMLQATFLLTLLAAGLIWWMLKRQLAPLQSTAKTLAALSDQHQSLHPLPIIRQDEIGQLISGFNRLLADLAQRQEGLRESEERYRTAFQTSPDAVNITRLADGRYLEVNDGFTHLFGWSREDVIGKTSRDIGIWCHWDDRYPLMHLMQKEGHCENFETTLATRHGKALTVLVSANRITLRGEPCMLSVTRDISERKVAEEQIEHLAFSDPLTGLPNRRLLIDRLQQAQAARAHHQNQGALLLVDLDHFKTLNDTLGHDTGDLLLQQAAQRLLACVREGDTVARSGGDEFVVLLKHLSQNPQEAATQAETVGEKILAALSQPYPFDSGPYHGTSSIGIALLGTEQENSIEPLKRAELAMYQGKAAGRNTLRFFDPQMQAVVSARAALEAGLREGILKNQFLLYYQAQVTDERRIIGVEVLVRWQDPRRGMVSPAEFIPLAEETGLILPLGSWAAGYWKRPAPNWRAGPANLVWRI